MKNKLPHIFGRRIPKGFRLKAQGCRACEATLGSRHRRRTNLKGLHQTTMDRSLTKRLMLRSEEHTSELQSLRHLVCRLLLEKKKKSTILSLFSGIVIMMIVARYLRLRQWFVAVAYVSCSVSY